MRNLWYERKNLWLVVMAIMMILGIKYAQSPLIQILLFAFIPLLLYSFFRVETIKPLYKVILCSVFLLIIVTASQPEYHVELFYITMITLGGILLWFIELSIKSEEKKHKMENIRYFVTIFLVVFSVGYFFYLNLR